MPHRAHGGSDPRVPTSDVLQHINEASGIPPLLWGGSTKYTTEYMFTDDTQLVC